MHVDAVSKISCQNINNENNYVLNTSIKLVHIRIVYVNKYLHQDINIVNINRYIRKKLNSLKKRMMRGSKLNVQNGYGNYVRHFRIDCLCVVFFCYFSWLH